MIKRILGLILIFAMILPCVSVMAESSDLVQTDLLYNGDMEWLGTSYVTWSGSHAPETAIIHGGYQSMKLTQNANRTIYPQTGTGIIPGETYTLTYWIYMEQAFETTYYLNGALQPAGAGAKLEISGTIIDSKGNSSEGTVASVYDIYNLTEEELGTWVKREVSLYVPKSGELIKGKTYYANGKFTVQIRPQGTGVVWYDDMALVGNVTSSTAETLNNNKEIYQDGYNTAMHLYNETTGYAANAVLADDAINIVGNPGFEDLYHGAEKLYRRENGEYYTIRATGENEISGAHSWGRSNYMMQQKDNPEHADKNITEADYEVIYRDEEVSRSGDYSLKLYVPDTYVSGNYPYTMQTISNGVKNCGEEFVAGAEYVLSAWIKTEDVGVGEGAVFKIQTNGPTTGNFGTQPVYYTDGQWHQIKYVFTMPEGTTSIHLYARLRGSGTIWYDDISLGRSSSNGYIDFKTKHTFYYTDEPEIEAFANFKSNIHEIDSGSSVVFSLIDYNAETVASQSFATVENMVCTFPTALLEKQKKYIIQAEYILADGTIKDTHRKNVYRYDRPTSMDTEGNIHDPETGEIIPPFFMYGAKYATLGTLADAGLEVVRINDMSLSDDDLQLKLDEAHAQGMKVLVALYGTVAGHPKQIGTTRRVVSKFHTHPAVAAWMLMDEPSLHVRPLGILTYEEMLYYLEEGYKAVRDIDPVHPVYNIETVGPTNDTYERTSQMCDIFAIDPYPTALTYSISGSLTTATQKAINAVYDERPVWVLGLAADWSAYGQPINSAMLRYQIYDALWTGAKGAGHYLSESSSFPEPSFTEIFAETFKKAAESGEIDEIFDHFSAGSSPTWAEGTGNGYQWQSWKKDNGDIYLAVMSKIGKDENNKNVVLDSLVTDIKLESSDGEYSINGFDAVLVNGVSETNISSPTSTFEMTLVAGEVSLYKITPKTGYTLSNLVTSSNATSVTVEYDVIKHITNEDETVIYAFYDADGRFLKMEKEPAAFESDRVTRTFDKVDFASMKVFIWDELGGLVPYSNMIE